MLQIIEHFAPSNNCNDTFEVRPFFVTCAVTECRIELCVLHSTNCFYCCQF